MYEEIVTISRSDEDQFTNDVNELLGLGWQVLSTSCGFVVRFSYGLLKTNL